MIRDKKNIDKLFEEGLKGFRGKPPNHSWDRLNNDLNKEKFRKTLVHVRWMAASLLILMAFGAGYFYAKYKINNQPEMVKDEIISQPYDQIESPSRETEKFVLTDNDNSDIEVQTPQDIIETSSGSEKTDNIVQRKNHTDKKQVIDSKEKAENLFTEIPSQETHTTKSEDSGMEVAEDVSISINEEVQEAKKLTIDIPTKNEEIANLEINPISPIYDDNFNLKPKKKQRWSVGAQFAPVLSYRDIGTSYSNGQGSGSNNTESDFNNDEEALLAFTGGVDVNYNFRERWSIQSGLYFSRIGQVNNNALNFTQENNQYLLYSINTSTGDISIIFEKVPDDIRKFEAPKDTIELIDAKNIKVVQNFDLFEIPFLIKYKILNKKLAINISGGLSPAYLLKNNTILEVESQKYDVGSSSNLNTMIFNTTFALGIEYALFKKLAINFEPTFKYSLNPINKDSQYNYHPYYLALYTGIRYSF